MFVVNLNKELAKVWNTAPPSGDEWHKGLIVSYLKNDTKEFLSTDIEALQTKTDWHDLPRDRDDEKGWRKYYPCFFTRYTKGKNNRGKNNKVYFPISDFEEFGFFDNYVDSNGNITDTGLSINSKIDNGIIFLSTLLAFNISLRKEDHDNPTRTVGAWGFKNENTAPYLLEIEVEQNGMYKGTPLPANFRDQTPENDNDNIQNSEGEPAMGHTDLKNEIYDLVIDKFQVILTGAPGTGKTYLAQEVAARMILGDSTQIQNPEEIEGELKDAGKLAQYKFVQFHPGYDYSDFVEGIKPKISAGPTDFSLEDGIFKKFCTKAAEEYKNAADKDIVPKFVMVIDEINRADLSRVFGELFFGLEKDYRGKEIRTQYDYLKRVPGKDDFKEGFSSFVIPPNLYIIGTMNDIDRSVESMDFALRRRFGWREISWEESLSIIDKKISDQKKKAVTKKIMTAVNQQIIKKAMELEDAFALGGAYFKDAESKSWDELWRHSIKIILNEYLRGNRCDKTIGNIEKLWEEIVNAEVPGTYPNPPENEATEA